MTHETKKAPGPGAFLFVESDDALLRGRIGAALRRPGCVASSFLRCFFGPLLQLFLQLLLVFLEHLRIGRRAVIGLGEFAPAAAAASAARRWS